MQSLREKAPSRLLPAGMLCISLFLLVFVTLLAFKNGRDAADAGTQLEVSGAIAEHSDDLLGALRDAETGQRGFLLTGKDTYLEPYNGAVAAIPGILNRLEQAAALRPDQAARIRALKPLVEVKLRELSNTIELRRTRSLEAAVAVVESDLGKATMGQLRERIAVINRIAAGRYAQFSAAAAESSYRLRLVSTVGGVLLFIFLSTAVASGFRTEIRREKLLELLQTTLGSIAEGVVVTDVEARVIFINAAAQNLCGWKEEEVAGRRVTEILILVSETTRQTVVNPLEEALSKGVPVGLANHTILIRKDGSEFAMDDSAAPIRLGTKIVGGVLVFRDISEKRHAELEVHELADQLRRSNQELEQFAYVASHDLRSPLNSVRNFAQLLEQKFAGELGSEGRQIIGFITSAASRMATLISDLLTFSEAGNVDASPASVSPQNALRAAMDNLAAEIAATSASVSFDNLPLVLAHEPSLTQVFQNLLSNAIKYRSAAAPAIHVSALAPGSECIISVRDNGVGFDPRYAEEIFRPFKRLQGQEIEGSGIGLATCQKIVQRYGGRMWAESVPGESSTFYLTLPLAQEQRAAGQA